ncbi:MAG: IS110 family transposase [Acidimicrobiales bacterium]|nr:IS110 family transposase [Acidimicrobiales bacterium]
MVLIGIDPHKGSHTAVAIDRDETKLAELRVRSSTQQCEQLLDWAAAFPDRRWAIESAGGLGYLLAQQLVAAGEDVVDVPPMLSSRVRVLGSGKGQKNDPNDALSTAIAALRGRQLRQVEADDHIAILRMLTNRHHQVVALHTQAACRLHAQLANLSPGGLSGRLSPARAKELLASVRPINGVIAERKQQANDLLDDVVRLHRELVDVKKRIGIAITASKTTVTDVYGVGPICAALILAHSGDPRRFKSRNHFASYNATARVEASSGPTKRHRLNQRGNRQINHALHVAAVTQIRNATPGRVYFDRKLEEGKSRKEALRALKRKISDAVYRQLIADAAR